MLIKIILITLATVCTAISPFPLALEAKFYPDRVTICNHANYHLGERIVYGFAYEKNSIRQVSAESTANFVRREFGSKRCSVLDAAVAAFPNRSELDDILRIMMGESSFKPHEELDTRERAKIDETIRPEYSCGPMQINVLAHFPDYGAEFGFDSMYAFCTELQESPAFSMHVSKILLKRFGPEIWTGYRERGDFPSVYSYRLHALFHIFLSAFK